MGLHPQMLVRVTPDRTVHLVAPGLERELQWGAPPRLNDFGLLLDTLALDLEGVGNAACVRDGEIHDSGGDAGLRQLDLPLGQLGAHCRGVARRMAQCSRAAKCQYCERERADGLRRHSM